MKFSQAKQGRTFVIRLENGEILHEEIERFARQQSIRAAALIVVGGADAGSRLVVGPEKARAKPIRPLEHVFDQVHEVVGTGTLFPDEKDNPILHMHIASGRKKNTVTGCVRSGVKVWQVMEVILFELTDTSGIRCLDADTGFELLEP
jgi:predicted DNA-binding protein with PD1-like motif